MSHAIINRSVTLKNRPYGLPGDDCWQIQTSELAPLGIGQIRVRNLYLSIDPAMRGWMNDIESYLPPVAIGETMRALAIGQVEASECESYKIGDFISGFFGVQEYATVTPDGSMTKVDETLAPLTTHLGLLGMPGMTAYFGLLDVGKPKKGETVLVSGAAGAVGALVGQIAKIQGCRVVGVAGGKEKCSYLTETLGFDAAIDYQQEKDLPAAVRLTCPDKVSVFFDNVGGRILDAAVENIGHRARIVICGAISQYNLKDVTTARVDYLPILYSSSQLSGFVILDYLARYQEAGLAMAAWLQEKRLIPHEDVRNGLETFPQTLRDLFHGQNFGKLILKVGEPAG